MASWFFSAVFAGHAFVNNRPFYVCSNRLHLVLCMVSYVIAVALCVDRRTMRGTACVFASSFVTRSSWRS